MAYELKEVSIEDLFNSQKTKERSLKSLKARAEEGIMSQVKQEDGKDYYDEAVSRVRVNAARVSKHPKVFWNEINRAMKNIETLDQDIIKELNAGKSEKDVVKEVAAKIRTKVRTFKKKQGKGTLVFSS